MEQSLTPQKLISLLGGFPDKPPLDVRVLEVWEHGTHQRQLIEYSTEGDERVQAFLLMPSQTAEKLKDTSTEALTGLGGQRWIGEGGAHVL